MQTQSNPENKALSVVVYGLGHIGRMAVEALLHENPFLNQTLALVGVVDVVAESRKWALKKGIAAYASLDALLKKTKVDVCIHTTSSYLEVVFPQLEEILQANIPVVSSCEELFFPWIQNSKLARRLEELCVENKVAVMGTGVNPGFVMDVLPALATQSSLTLQGITVKRIVDASTRRLPLQKKIGLGLTESEFRKGVQSQKIGHVGLLESLDFLANYVGWNLEERTHTIKPISAPHTMKTKLFQIRKGRVIGLHQRALGKKEGKKVLELDLKIQLHPATTGDYIFIQGHPPLSIHIQGGTAGDQATIATLIRGIPLVLNAKPGLIQRMNRTHFTKQA